MDADRLDISIGGVVGGGAVTKRGYSRAFRPHGDSGKRYLLDAIPAGLWAAVRAKCKRDGISVRAQILALLAAWVAE